MRTAAGLCFARPSSPPPSVRRRRRSAAHLARGLYEALLTRDVAAAIAALETLLVMFLVESTAGVPPGFTVPVGIA